MGSAGPAYPAPRRDGAPGGGRRSERAPPAGGGRGQRRGGCRYRGERRERGGAAERSGREPAPAADGAAEAELSGLSPAKSPRGAWGESRLAPRRGLSRAGPGLGAAGGAGSLASRDLRAPRQQPGAGRQREPRFQLPINNGWKQILESVLNYPRAAAGAAPRPPSSRKQCSGAERGNFVFLRGCGGVSSLQKPIQLLSRSN